MSLRQEKSCGAVVFRKKGARVFYLLVKHFPAGHWGIPKGHGEPGETEVQTALREVKEETGLDLRLVGGWRRSIQYFPKALVRKEVVYFLGEADRKKITIQEKELSNALWLELEDALVLATHEGTRDVLRMAESALGSGSGLDPTPG